MTAIRVAKRKRFTTVDRAAVNDARLSFRARGLLVWILDKPDDWTVDSRQIAHSGKEGRDAIQAALRELREAGYVHQEKRQVERGRWVTETVVYEVPPEPGFPAPDNRAPVDRAPEDPALSTEELLPKTVTETARADSLLDSDPFEEEFARWWSVYPRKASKIDARYAYAAARRRGAGAKELLRAAEHYAEEREGEDVKFTKHATTFLRQDRWRDHAAVRDPQPGDEDYRSETDMLRDIR